MYTQAQIHLARSIRRGLALAREAGFKEGYDFLKKMAHDELKDNLWRFTEGSMIDESACIVYYDDELGQSWLEGGFMPPWIMNDKDAENWCRRNALTIVSPYDCTGREFTAWTKWHRNPCGRYSFVRREEIDC